MGAPNGMFDPLTLPRRGAPGMPIPGMPMPGMEPGLTPAQVEPTLSYSNQYGTDLSAGYNIGSQEFNARAVIPVGDATAGNRLELRGGYGPGGASAFLGFKKINVPSLSGDDVRASAAKMDPGYAKYLAENPAAVEESRLAHQKRMREEALGINRIGAPAYQVGLDVFGGGRKAGEGPFAGAMEAVMQGMPR